MKMTMDKSSMDVYGNHLRWIGFVLVGLVLQTGRTENLLREGEIILRQRTPRPLVNWPVSAKGMVGGGFRRRAADPGLLPNVLTNLTLAQDPLQNIKNTPPLFTVDLSAANTTLPSVTFQRRVGNVFPVTFKAATAYVITKWKIYSTFTIYFQIRTLEANGLLFFSSSGVLDKDFLAIELSDGAVRYIFDTGNGAQTLQATSLISSRPINDGQWHDIGIQRTDLMRQVLIVDECIVEGALAPESRSVHFDLNDDVYIGGVPGHMYQVLPKQVRARDGFHGCVASVSFNGKTRNLMDQTTDIPDSVQHLIKGGCEGPGTDCQSHVCENGGACVQQWNSFTCDCDMTSFTGRNCNDESVAYSFGHSGGLITYTFPDGEWPDSKMDRLALGFITTQHTAVLVRIVSGSSNDYIEMELVDGNIYVGYNMGLTDHVIGELFTKVNDGKYHIVRFVRNGANSTIQVDNLPVQPKNPPGLQLTTFNHQVNVFVGGKKDVSGHLVRHFHGTMAGLTLNGLHVLEMAAEGNRRIQIEGDVDLEVKQLRPQSNSYSSSSSSFSSLSSLKMPPPLQQQTTTIETNPTKTTPTKKTKKTKTRENRTDRSDEATQVTGAAVGWWETVTTSAELTSAVVVGPLHRPTMKSSSSALTDLNLPGTTSLPSEGSGNPFPCDESDDEDCDDDDQFSGSSRKHENHIPVSDSSNADGSEGTGETRTDTEEDAPVMSSSSVSLTASMSRLKDKEGPSNTTTTTTTKPSAASMVAVAGALQSTTATPPSSVSRVSASVGGRRAGASPSSRNEETEVGGGGTKVSSTGDDGRGQHRSVASNVGLIVGVVVGVVLLLLVLIFGLYKYRSRDEGTYKIDNRNYTYEVCSSRTEENGGGGGGGGVYKLRSLKSKQKRKDVKEWYV